MTKQERINKLQWVLHLCGELESEGVNMGNTKEQVVNKIKELSC